MTDSEAAEKLKSRLDSWQAYLENSKPISAVAEDAATAPEMPQPPHPKDTRKNVNGHRAFATPGYKEAEIIAPASATAAIPEVASGIEAEKGAAASAVSTADSPPIVLKGRVVLPTDATSRVSELEAQVAHEREQARLLSEAIAREQMLHAATLKTVASTIPPPPMNPYEAAAAASPPAALFPVQQQTARKRTTARQQRQGGGGGSERYRTVASLIGFFAFTAFCIILLLVALDL